MRQDSPIFWAILLGLIAAAACVGALMSRESGWITCTEGMVGGTLIVALAAICCGWFDGWKRRGLFSHCDLLLLAVIVYGLISLLGPGFERSSVIASTSKRLVVLTFDDSVASHYAVVRPILKEYGFGATFFITEGFDFKTNKDLYMTWEQIAELHRDGFEIGNHTRDHMGVNDGNVAKLAEQLGAINAQCEKHGIPRTVTFAWPGNSHTPKAFEVLRRAGIRFARRGGAPEYPYEGGRGFAYEPGRDHPLLIPSAGDARPDWTLQDFIRAVEQAKDGRIAVLQFHGVPDIQHPWVHTDPDKFRQYMKYLKDHNYQVIALRDLAKYVDPTKEPERWDAVIEDRKQAIGAQ